MKALKMSLKLMLMMMTVLFFTHVKAGNRACFNVEESNDTLTVTFKVKGTVACKSNIESSVSSKEGVLQASWNSSTGDITIKYLPAQISLTDLHTHLAMAGYDTSELRAKDPMYNSLSAECKYTRDPITE